MSSDVSGVAERARPPRLVGRDDELAALDAELDRVVAGSFRVVLISGGAGVGKTRLADEGLARRTGAATRLSARSYRWGATTPFGPWVEALDRDLRDRPEEELRHLVGGSLAELAGLLTPLAALDAGGRREPRRDRLLVGLVDLFDRLSDERPVLLALDDLHLADPSSWEALRYLGRRLSGSPIGVVITVRPELMRQHPIAVEVVLGLGEDGVLRRIPLAPLGDGAATELVRDVLGSHPLGASRPVPAALVSWLLERSRGHPLFIVSLLSALLEEGADLASPRLAALPEDLRDRVAVEVGALDRDARSVLELLAVIERRCALDDLAVVAGRSVAAVGDITDRLRASALVTEDGAATDVRYEIAHPVIQEAIYSGLGPGRRRALHRAVAEALSDAGQLGAAAAHFSRSAPPGDSRAVRALCRAMRQAEERDQYQEALAILDGLLDALPPGDRRWLDVLEVMTWRSEWVIGHLAEGDADVAIAAMERIRPLVGPTDDPATGTVALHLAAFLSIGAGRLEDAEEACRRAVDAFASAGDGSGLLLARNELSWILGCSGDFHRQAELAGEVVAETQADGHGRAAMHAAGSRGYALARLGRFSDAEAALRRAIDTARAVGDTYRVAWARNHLGVLEALTGRPQEGRRTVRSALDDGPMAPDSGTLEYLAHTHWLCGDLASCVDRVEDSEVRRSMRGSRRRAWSLALAARAYAEMDQHSRAVRRTAQARTTYAGRPILDWAWWCDWADAFLAWHNGEHTRALEGLDRACGWLRDAGAPTYEVLPLLDVAEVAADGGSASTAEDAAARLAEIARTVGGALHPALAGLGSAWAHLARGASSRAAAAAAGAARRFSEAGYRLHAASALEAAGRAQVGDDREAALRALRDAADTFEACAASWRRDRVLSLLNTLGMRGRRAATGVLGPQALTPREQEVAVLAARGYTAQETAERLFISRRTVESHLQSAYPKLGVSSKRELVRRAAELGLE